MSLPTDVPLRVAGRGFIKLAPGIRLTTDSERFPTLTLVLASDAVQLNQPAATILELCDGTRTWDRLVIDAVMLEGGSMRTVDVVRFLEQAIGRGWIVEAV